MTQVNNSVTLIEVPGDPQKQEQYGDRLSLEASHHDLFLQLDRWLDPEDESCAEKRAFFDGLVNQLCDIRLEIHLLRFGEESLDQ